MTIPESVRDAAETLRQLGVEDESISIDWENAPQEVFEDVRRVLEWAIENLLNSDDGLRHIPLPPDVNQSNGGVPCDMQSGPCSCGAWHSDDDEPCSNRAFVSLASVFADSLHEFAGHYIAMVNGVRVYFYKGCEVRSSAMQVTDFGGLIPSPSDSQVRKLLEALKGGPANER